MILNEEISDKQTKLVELTRLKHLNLPLQTFDDVVIKVLGVTVFNKR